ncbi:hypothetical protein NP568_24040 [Vibrio parahaemolyticus]|nr:hypothetical protein [Vibrio parahaemolyticus]
MQDIDWSDGSFGYLPWLTLGAMWGALFLGGLKKQGGVVCVIQSGGL